ncbi:MAG TPA: YSC84-related protein, partial [Acidobacteriota bacterium]|nr:YSC84-related protein [Acidobacteriota bacterium]
YVLFIMKDHVLEDFQNSSGFELGVGPSVVVVDAGAAKSMTTMTLKEDIYAFIFGQKGLMAGLGVKGSKITKINK